MLNDFVELLKAQNKAYAVAVSNYLLSQIEIDESLRNKLDVTEKTLVQCVDYVKGEAKKVSTDGVAIMTDDEVYQLVKHFFLEDSIEAKPQKTKTIEDDELDEDDEQAKPKKEVQKKVKRVKEKLYEQMSLFD